jgi:predicted TIM-barrel fold metal-dependent hydrolase
LPQHAWDTHVHVFDPANYPYAAERLYTPETAKFESLLAFNGNISMTQTPQNLVLVQPSPYGTDNSLVIDILREHARRNQTSGQKLRAIVVIEENEVTDEQLSGWDEIGVRGFRVNVESSAAGIDYEELKRTMNETAHRVKKFDNWKCQLYVARETWDREYHRQPPAHHPPNNPQTSPT